MKYSNPITFFYTFSFLMILCCCEKFGGGCFAQNRGFSPNSPYQLSPVLDGGLGALGAGTLIGSQVMMRQRKPLTLKEISNLDPNDINGFDRTSRQLTWQATTPMADGMLYGAFVLPAVLLTNSTARSDWGHWLIMMAEVLAINNGINGMMKYGVGRARPFTYFDDAPLEEKQGHSGNLSFYSGHTSNASAMSFFTAKTLTDYMGKGENQGLKVGIWSMAVLYPAIVGYSRWETGRHFKSDVLVGYGAGALIGYMVPFLHKKRKKDSRSTLMPMGNGVAWEYRF